MKKFILFVVLGLFLFSGVTFAQALTPRQKQIYSEVRDKFMEKFINDYPSTSRAYLDELSQETANKYGISKVEVDEILMKGYANITMKESDIADKLWQKLNGLSASATSSQVKKIFKSIANHYHISVEALEDIAFKTM